jgi:hypothetical protein
MITVFLTIVRIVVQLQLNNATLGDGQSTSGSVRQPGDPLVCPTPRIIEASHMRKDCRPEERPDTRLADFERRDLQAASPLARER